MIINIIREPQRNIPESSYIYFMSIKEHFKKSLHEKFSGLIGQTRHGIGQPDSCLSHDSSQDVFPILSGCMLLGRSKNNWKCAYKAQSESRNVILSFFSPQAHFPYTRPLVTWCYFLSVFLYPQAQPPKLPQRSKSANRHDGKKKNVYISSHRDADTLLEANGKESQRHKKKKGCDYVTINELHVHISLRAHFSHLLSGCCSDISFWESALFFMFSCVVEQQFLQGNSTLVISIPFLVSFCPVYLTCTYMKFIFKLFHLRRSL